jgi:hypothetical protein
MTPIKWNPSTTLLASFLSLLLGFLVWMGNEQLTDIEFRAAGGRFTTSDADRMHGTIMAECELEQRRLQCQIDRLEGHTCVFDGL